MSVMSYFDHISDFDLLNAPDVYVSLKLTRFVCVIEVIIDLDLLNALDVYDVLLCYWSNYYFIIHS